METFLTALQVEDITRDKWTVNIVVIMLLVLFGAFFRAVFFHHLREKYVFFLFQ